MNLLIGLLLLAGAVMVPIGLYTWGDWGPITPEYASRNQDLFEVLLLGTCTSWCTAWILEHLRRQREVEGES